MNRRQFVQTVGIGAVTTSLTGCGVPGGSVNETSGIADLDSADVSVTLVRNAPENPGPYEDPVGTVTSQESEELVVDGFTFQRAGEKGLVVAGEATNGGDRQFRTVVVEVTLHDRTETEDDASTSVSAQTTRDGLDTGETWQWATNFDEQDFQIDYYLVRASANYA